MLLSQRRRQRSYALAGTTQNLLIRRVIAACILLLIVYWIGSRILRFFGVGNPRERSSVMVQIDKGSSAEVSLDSSDWQRAESGMKMYWDDALRTGADTYATLSFFDRSLTRLNEQSEVYIEDSAKGKRESTIAINLKRGALWVATPSALTFSGGIVRTIRTPKVTYTLAPGTEAFIGENTALVFRAQGEGITISVRGHDDIVIGEGQKWAATGATLVNDLYAYRSPLDALSARNPFITESRTTLSSFTQASSSSAAMIDGEFLTLITPEVGAAMEGASLVISGKVTADVTRVVINGRDVPIEEDDVSFKQTMAPPDGTDDVVVNVQAYDIAGTLLGNIKRLVKRLPMVLTPPGIDSPAKAGDTYRTQKQEFVMRGTAPRGATGIMVNDYLLQLFDPAKGTWSYLAAVRLGNLHEGENRFDVFALYPGPGGSVRKSEPSTVIIRIEEGEEGVLSTTASAGSAGSVGSTKPVLNNPPLKPGTLAVIAPNPGNSATVNGTGTLIEGTTSRDTDTMWVNDYRLQLYVAGKTTWNYIADPDLKTLKPGKNTFVIIARNAKGEVIDRLEYVIEYTP